MAFFYPVASSQFGVRSWCMVEGYRQRYDHVTVWPCLVPPSVWLGHKGWTRSAWRTQHKSSSEEGPTCVTKVLLTRAATLSSTVPVPE